MSLVPERLVFLRYPHHLERFAFIPFKHAHSVSISSGVLILSFQIYCETMCHGPEDPSQRATKSPIQRYPGEGFHRHNQGDVKVFACFFF